MKTTKTKKTLGRKKDLVREVVCRINFEWFDSFSLVPDLKQRGRKKFNAPIFFAEIISAFMVEKSCDAKKPETRCRPPNATAVRKNP